ncbi:hypothetical protein FHV99_004713 [Ochrobactrum sp. P20RRXII]|nr:hypothetical protein [Ochrobactrum sp. P20RRXII]NIH77461.1 hypothetical protein [Ochrobactrum sp. P20RRXII]
MTPNFVPGCYGSALAYRSKDLVCRQCPLSERCGLLSEQNKAALRAKYGVKAKPVSPTDQKVAKVVGALRKLNLNIRSKLVKYENPFATTQPALFFMTEIMIELHKLKKPATEKWLAAAVSQKMQSDQKGAIHILCKAFEELGLLARSENSIYLEI